MDIGYDKRKGALTITLDKEEANEAGLLHGDVLDSAFLKQIGLSVIGKVENGEMVVQSFIMTTVSKWAKGDVLHWDKKE